MEASKYHTYDLQSNTLLGADTIKPELRELSSDMECEAIGSCASSRSNPLKRKDTDSEPSCGPQKRKINDTVTLADRQDAESNSPIEELLDFCNDINTGITAKGIRYLKEKIQDTYAQFQEIVLENTSLKQKISEKTSVEKKVESLTDTISGVVENLNELRREISKCPKSEPTYAQKLSTPYRLAQQQATRPPKHIVTVYPKEDSKINSSEETKAAIMSSFLPAKEKLRIRNVRKISNKGVLIETATKDDMNTVLLSKKLDSAGLTANLPSKRSPRMIISNIPKEMEEKELLAAIRQQNLKDFSKTKFAEEFTLSFRTGNRKRDVVNWVVEVSPEVRDILLKENRVFIGWQACYVRDFVSVTRCYKCQSFGHVSKHCKAQEDTCGHCGQNGHSFNTCPNNSKDPTCINCKRANKPHAHSSRANDCPAYRNAMESNIVKIDYGRTS